MFVWLANRDYLNLVHRTEFLCTTFKGKGINNTKCRIRCYLAHLSVWVGTFTLNKWSLNPRKILDTVGYLNLNVFCLDCKMDTLYIIGLCHEKK